MSGIEKRKQRHLDHSLEKNVTADITTGFEDVRLVHRALPEINLEDVNTETILFGKKLSAPLIISAITGGTKRAKKINETLAEIAEKTGIGVSVGSQRIAIQNPETKHTFKIVREKAPSTLILGNIGAPQLSLGWGINEAKEAVDMIDADALAIHMNALQEAVQVDGDTYYQNVLFKIHEITNNLKVPVILKETGCGIAYEDAVLIEKNGVEGIEISGLGGTSWSAVEYHIAKEEKKSQQEYLGQALWNWGIPTVVSLVEVSQSTNMKIIASGGIRTGVEMVKSIVLGANAVGIAKPFLEKAMKGSQSLEEYVNNIIQEFRVIMFLLGAKNIDELSKTPAIILGKTAEWLKLRGFNPDLYMKNR